MVLSAPFFLCKPHLTPGVSGVFGLIQLGLMKNFEKLGFSLFCRYGQREANLEEFDAEVGGWLPLLHEISLPPLTGEDLAEVVRRTSAAAGSLDGWRWKEMKVFPVPWFDGRAHILKVEEVDVWSEGLLDAFAAMIPKFDGDATPLVQRPLSVLRTV